MDPFNPFIPSNPNPNPSNPNPNPSNPNPNPNENPMQNLFSAPGYYPSMDPSWSSSQFSYNAFSSYQQSPNAFSQMSQHQAVQQMMMRNQSSSQPRPFPTEDSPQEQSLEDRAEEFVPETQPQPSRRRKGKAAMVERDQTSRPKQKLWTKLEEEALAKAWVGTSKCPIVGNNQTGEGFWRDVLGRFLAIMEQGDYRDVDSVSSKWRKMHPVVNRFSAIYNNLYTSNRRSGMSDEDVYIEAMRQYEDLYRVAFPHVRVWEVLRTTNKWAPVPNEVSTAKRTKTSETGSYSAGGSDAHCQININDDPEFDVDEHPVQEEQRPMGRNKAKRGAAERRQAEREGGGKLEEFMEHFKTFTEVSARKAKAKEREVEEMTWKHEWDIMSTDINSCPPEDRAVLRKMKEEIAKKWNS